MLNSDQPMLTWWGPDLIQFYNYAYRRNLPSDRYLRGLDEKAHECWARQWDRIGPKVELVRSRQGAIWRQDQIASVMQNGKSQKLRWNYGLSPIADEVPPSGVGGVLVGCRDVAAGHLARETLRSTEVTLRRALSATEERLRLNLDAAVIGPFDWGMPQNFILADEHLADIFGLDPAQAAAGVAKGV